MFRSSYTRIQWMRYILCTSMAPPRYVYLGLTLQYKLLTHIDYFLWKDFPEILIRFFLARMKVCVQVCNDLAPAIFSRYVDGVYRRDET